MASLPLRIPVEIEPVAEIDAIGWCPGPGG